MLEGRCCVASAALFGPRERKERLINCWQEVGTWFLALDGAVDQISTDVSIELLTKT